MQEYVGIYPTDECNLPKVSMNDHRASGYSSGTAVQVRDLVFGVGPGQGGSPNRHQGTQCGSCYLHFLCPPLQSFTPRLPLASLPHPQSLDSAGKR